MSWFITSYRLTEPDPGHNHLDADGRRYGPEVPGQHRRRRFLLVIPELAQELKVNLTQYQAPVFN
jgi:hypothetical protein